MRRFISIICLFFPSMILAQQEDEPLPRALTYQERDSLEDQESESAEARLQRINKEIASLGRHQWAGRYYYGDGLGSNNSLSIAPKSGAYVYGAGCLGRYLLNHGDIEKVTDDRIEVRWVIPPDVLVAPTLVRVKWGERRYLVFSNDIDGFLEHAATGQESANPMTGFLHELDRGRAVLGAPIIPPDYLQEHDAPVITGSVLETKPDVHAFNMFRADTLLTTVWLNIGSDDGIKDDDRLYPADAKEFGAGVFSVCKVEARRCQATLWKVGPSGDPPKAPEVGPKVTTFPPSGLVARKEVVDSADNGQEREDKENTQTSDEGGSKSDDGPSGLSEPRRTDSGYQSVTRATTVSEQPEDSLSEVCGNWPPEEDAATREQRERIEAELEGLAKELESDAELCEEYPWAAEWAGKYTDGILGASQSVSLAPRSGVLVEYWGCFGYMNSFGGTIASSISNGLWIDFCCDSERLEDNSRLSNRMYFVRWGECRYLVPESKMVDFCNQFNRGGAVWDAMLRREDDRDFIAGLPEVPAQYTTWLHPEPVPAQIFSVSNVRRVESPYLSSGIIEADVQIDVGEQDKVFVGMEFFGKRSPRTRAQYSLEVISVDGGTSRALFTMYESYGTLDFARTRAGDSVSTQWH